MAAKDRSAPAKKELKKTVKKLRSKLDRADATVETLKRQAAKLDKARAELEAQVAKLTKRNKKLERTATAPVVVSAPIDPVPEPAPAAAVNKPDETWTVAQLRAEARDRGLTGMSGKTKAELLAALR